MTTFVAVRYLCLVSSMVLIVAGCAREPAQTVNTVDYYLAHPDETERRLAECANNPGETENDPDCINAAAAGAQLSLGSLRDLPPIGLQQPNASDRKAPDAKGTESTDRPR